MSTLPLYVSLARHCPCNIVDVFANIATFGSGQIEHFKTSTGHTISCIDEPQPPAVSQRNGRGCCVVGNTIYYTNLQSGFSGTGQVYAMDLSGTDMGSVITTGWGGISTISYDGAGHLYLQPYISPVDTLWSVYTTGGAFVSTVLAPMGTNYGPGSSDGFTYVNSSKVLKNHGDTDGSYYLHDINTGLQIGTNPFITVAGSGTGIDYDSVYKHYYIAVNFNTIYTYDDTGAFVRKQSALDSACSSGRLYEDISVQH